MEPTNHVVLADRCEICGNSYIGLTHGMDRVHWRNVCVLRTAVATYSRGFKPPLRQVGWPHSGMQNVTIQPPTGTHSIQAQA